VLLHSEIDSPGNIHVTVGKNLSPALQNKSALAQTLYTSHSSPYTKNK